MIPQKVLWWAFMLQISLCSCQSEKKKEGFVKGKSHYEISQIGQLPDALKETSGLALADKNDTFWTHNDSGNPSEIYKIATDGTLLETLPLPQIKNKDWEDLAKDPYGNLYLADVGNNNNRRRDLKIYKFNPQNPQNIETIAISYTDQKDFPPLPDQQNFDCEAVAWHQNQLYLFSKNRSKTNRYVKLYAFPDQAGTYTAAPQDSVYSKAMATAADVSPDGKTLALLTYGKVLLFDISQGMNFNKPTYCIKIGKGQAEALVFINNTDFVFTNESKGEVYLAKQKKKGN
ncbi:MAG: SdiA-regulated domain-containing protein [Runella sp.]